MSVKVERRETLVYSEDCLLCGKRIEAPSEKRLQYLIEEHKFWRHERGLVQ